MFPTYIVIHIGNNSYDLFYRRWFAFFKIRGLSRRYLLQNLFAKFIICLDSTLVSLAFDSQMHGFFFFFLSGTKQFEIDNLWAIIKLYKIRIRTIYSR